MSVARPDRSHWWIAGVVLLQVTLTMVALSLDHWEHAEAMVGLGEAQMALGVLLLVCGTLRWSQRLPIAVLLLFSGWVLHCICWVSFKYPMIAGEEYFTSLGTAFAMFLILVGVRSYRVFSRRRDAELSPATRPMSRGAFSIGDLLLWMFVVGAVLVIVQRAFVLTDLSGIMDPWESFSFGCTQDLNWVAAKLPRLGLAIVWQGLMWTVISLWLLTQERWRWWYSLQIIGLFVAFTLGEIVIVRLRGLEDHPWRFLPPGMFPVQFLSITWDLFFGEKRQDYDPNDWLFKVGVILITRLSVFATSLGLLRSAGFRLCPRSR